MALAISALPQTVRAQKPIEAQASGDLAREAESFLAQGDTVSARGICLRAMALPNLSEDTRGNFLFLLASTHTSELDEAPATERVEQILSLPSATGDLKARAHLILGKMLATFGGLNSWTKAIERCNHALNLPALSESIQIEGRSLRAGIALQLRQFEMAHADFLFLATRSNPAQSTASYLNAARALWMAQNFAEANRLLDQVQLAGAAPDSDLTADLLLLRGILQYDQNQLDQARSTLLAVCALPSQSPVSTPFREARLRLHLKKMVPAISPSMKVLFIGSSHTQRGNVPLLVEQLADSAPSHVPRIFAGEKTRMGTGMRSHWNEGDAPDTARGRLAAEPWDAVVVETFFRNPREDLALWTSRYLELVQNKGARLVLYESPAAKALPYPDGFREFHSNNLWLASQFAVTLAPCMDAWMRILGATPSEPDFRTLYADWIHATPQGAYLSACCIFSALTGCSAEGLFHPPELPAQLALTYQRAAWSAFQQARGE
jgi:tetratricopeptide (TPR) repeat protein